MNEAAKKIPPSSFNIHKGGKLWAWAGWPQERQSVALENSSRNLKGVWLDKCCGGGLGWASGGKFCRHAWRTCVLSSLDFRRARCARGAGPTAGAPCGVRHQPPAWAATHTALDCPYGQGGAMSNRYSQAYGHSHRAAGGGEGLGWVGLAASCRSRPSGVGFLPCPTTRLNYLTVRQGLP